MIKGFKRGLIAGIILSVVATIIIIKFYRFDIWSVVLYAGILFVCGIIGAVNSIVNENEERHRNCKNTVDRLANIIHKSYEDSTVESKSMNDIKISTVKLHYMPDGVNDSILINWENYNAIITKLNNTYIEIRIVEDVMRQSILDNMRESFEYWENEKRYVDIK